MRSILTYEDIAVAMVTNFFGTENISIIVCISPLYLYIRVS